MPFDVQLFNTAGAGHAHEIALSDPILATDLIWLLDDANAWLRRFALAIYRRNVGIGAGPGFEMKDLYFPRETLVMYTEVPGEPLQAYWFNRSSTVHVVGDVDPLRVSGVVKPAVATRLAALTEKVHVEASTSGLPAVGHTGYAQLHLQLGNYEEVTEAMPHIVRDAYGFVDYAIGLLGTDGAIVNAHPTGSLTLGPTRPSHVFVHSPVPEDRPITCSCFHCPGKLTHVTTGTFTFELLSVCAKCYMPC